VIGRQPLLDRLLVVIRPLVEVRSAGIALSFNLWRVELNVIGGAALAHPSSCDPLDQLLIGNIDIQDHIDLLAQSGQNFVQSLRLGHGSGESVQHPSGLNIILGQAVFDDIDQQGIRNQLSCIHELLSLNPQGGAAADVLPQNVTGRDVGDLVLVSNHLSLCALAGSRRAEQYNIHLSNPPIPITQQLFAAFER